jgi:hypothetical protein
VLEPVCRDEGGAGSRALEERFRCDRRAVREVLDPARVHSERLDGRKHGFDLAPSRGDLRRAQAAFVEQS